LFLASSIAPMQSGYEHAAAALETEVAQVTAVLGDISCLSAIHCWKVYADRLAVAANSAEQVGGWVRVGGGGQLCVLAGL
jgi:hypothetical protein